MDLKLSNKYILTTEAYKGTSSEVTPLFNVKY